IVPHQKSYEVIPSRNIVFGFNNIGYTVIEQYGDRLFYCFDDLGVEPIGRHFGKDCKVMGEILLSRYDLFLKHQVKTHATTNLNADELEERYGNRVRSRMRQLFNLIPFEKKARINGFDNSGDILYSKGKNSTPSKPTIGTSLFTTVLL